MKNKIVHIAERMARKFAIAEAAPIDSDTERRATAAYNALRAMLERESKYMALRIKRYHRLRSGLHHICMELCAAYIDYALNSKSENDMEKFEVYLKAESKFKNFIDDNRIMDIPQHEIEAYLSSHNKHLIRHDDRGAE